MNSERRGKNWSDPKFVGLDLSFSSTGLIILDKNAEILKEEVIRTDKNLSVEERIIQIENAISFIPNIVGLFSVYVEGPSFSSKGNILIEMGALNYFVRIFLLKNNVQYKIVAPTLLKKFVCGNGSAQKDLILLNVYKKWNVSFENHNLADAYGLCRMALDEYNIILEKDINKFVEE